MKIVKYILAVLILIGITLTAVYQLMVDFTPPDNADMFEEVTVEIQKESNGFSANNGSWLKKNAHGTWEMYLTGGPFERGKTFGLLATDLQFDKEKAFYGEIKNRIPDDNYLKFLKYILGWVNRDLDDYIQPEYLAEIYASSHYLPDSFDFIGSKFERGLSYHAAHDIGHALQNMNLVGCTSFAVSGGQTENNKLLLGRNFDFYFGEEFAKEPIIAFFKPDSGYGFLSVTWACFSGVVSGMNEEGISITLNAAKSDWPSKGKTPVSLIAREILQYASTIDEAFEIAKKHESFVAETFLIGSKKDGTAALIEKTPEQTVLLPQKNHRLIATNHFQSDALQSDPKNQEYLAEGVSQYRFQRVKELLDSLGPINPQKAAFLLRDKCGDKGCNIGLANEKSINQLVAHHSIIFSPEDLMVWVSTPPYQLGKYLAYDLKKIFKGTEVPTVFTTDSMLIDADGFASSAAFTAYTEFVRIRDMINRYLAKGTGPEPTAEEVNTFIAANPEGYLTYYLLGDYFMAKEKWAKAANYYQMGLQKEVAKESERKHMLDNLNTCETKLKS